MMTATSLRLRLCSSRREKRYSSLLCRLTQHRSFLFYFIYIFPSLVVVVAIVVWKHGRYTRCTQRGALTLFSTLRNEWRPPTGSHRFSLYWTRSSPRCHGRWGECISPHTPPASVAPLLLLLIPFCRKRERESDHCSEPFAGPFSLLFKPPRKYDTLCARDAHYAPLASLHDRTRRASQSTFGANNTNLVQRAPNPKKFPTTLLWLNLINAIRQRAISVSY
jgi:hypothetical protein